MKTQWFVVACILVGAGCNAVLGINDGANRLHNGDACALPSDCTSGYCVHNVCTKSACGEACSTPCSECGPDGTCVPKTEGSHCLGGTCNGSGECLSINGSACTNASTKCASGFCADGVCCDQQCTGMCMTCKSGMCTNVPPGEIDLTSSCVGTMVCDGSGECKTANAQSCTDDDQCVSGVCANTLCSARSCIGLGTICGPSSNENCCDAPSVTGGTYNRSNDTKYPAQISKFRLDRFEVTVGRFRKFVEAYPGSMPNPGAGAHVTILGSGWAPVWNSQLPTDKASLMTQLRTCEASSKPPWLTDPVIQWPEYPHPKPEWPTTSSSSSGMTFFVPPGGGDFPHFPPGSSSGSPGPFPPLSLERSPTWSDEPSDSEGENLALNCVTWFEAFAFCAWDGGRLVTEAEWNYAATAGSEQREYPWGSATPNNTYTALPISEAFPVGSRSPKGDGKWRQADLAGSMDEWNLDAYHESYNTPCVDCAALSYNGPRVLRSGLPSSLRNSASPDSRSPYVGFRCAR